MAEDVQKRLFDAVNDGDLAALRSVLSETAPSEESCSHALFWAARQGFLDCLRELIPVSDPKSGGSLALLFAAKTGHAECLRALIPVSDPSADGSAALQAAAGNGSVECVRALIPFADSADATLALIRAAGMGRLGCVDALLPLSDPDGRGEEGLAAAELADQNGHRGVADHIRAYFLAQDELALLEGQTPASARPGRRRL